MQERAAKSLAVVTEAADGLGYELARQFADHGFDVLICATGESVSRAAGALARNGATVRSVRADLGTSEGVQRLVAEVRAAAGRLQMLAICVAADDRSSPRAPADDVRLLRRSVLGPVELVRGLLPMLRAHGQGQILVAGHEGRGGDAVSGAASAFLRSYAEGLRAELSGVGVGVTVLLPGDAGLNEPGRNEPGRNEPGRNEPGRNEPGLNPVVTAEVGFAAVLAGRAQVVVHRAT